MQYRWFLRPPLFGARCSVLGAPCESILTHMVQYCQAPSAIFFKPSSWTSKSSAIENILKISGRRVGGRIRRLVVGFGGWWSDSAVSQFPSSICKIPLPLSLQLQAIFCGKPRLPPAPLASLNNPWVPHYPPAPPPCWGYYHPRDAPLSRVLPPPRIHRQLTGVRMQGSRLGGSMLGGPG